MKWKRDFANVPQGFVTSNGMPSRDGRESAQEGAILIITGGKCAFKYQRAVKARELNHSTTSKWSKSCACQRETTPRRPVGKPLDGTPHGGPLHVLMPLQWSKFRDSFNELTALMG